MSNEKLFVDLKDEKKYGGRKIICRFEKKRWYVVLFVDLTNKKKLWGLNKKKLHLGIICRFGEKMSMEVERLFVDLNK